MTRLGAPSPVSSVLRRASLIYPQPVAIACGRVIRARSQAERLDACLRAGEVLARYVSAVALSSFAAREGGDALNITASRRQSVLSGIFCRQRSRLRTLRCLIQRRLTWMPASSRKRTR